MTIKRANEIAKQYNHTIKTSGYSVAPFSRELVVRGEFFPTGYYCDDLKDALGTLYFELRRHHKVIIEVSDFPTIK